MSSRAVTHMKKGICDFLRDSSRAFINHITPESATPSQRRDADSVSHELNCLFTLYEAGLLDPVQALKDAPLDHAGEGEAAPLCGTSPH